MSNALPPNHIAEPTDEQLKLAKRIARQSGRTVEQVLAEAISRGSSAQFTDVLSGRSPPLSKPN